MSSFDVESCRHEWRLTSVEQYSARPRVLEQVLLPSRVLTVKPSKAPLDCFTKYRPRGLCSDKSEHENLLLSIEPTSSLRGLPRANVGPPGTRPPDLPPELDHPNAIPFRSLIPEERTATQESGRNQPRTTQKAEHRVTTRVSAIRNF